MQMHGFIRDMMDVKVLILYVMAHADYPMDAQKTFELCYQDDKLSYFDVCEALPQLVSSGHLSEDENGFYTITEKGREACSVTEDTIAYPVMLRAQAAVEQFNRMIRRSSFVKTDIQCRGEGEYAVELILNDERSDLLRIELLAPSQKHAHRLAKAFTERAEGVYRVIMDQLLTENKEDT